MIFVKKIAFVCFFLFLCAGYAGAYDYSEALKLGPAHYPDASSITVADLTEVVYQENGDSRETSYMLVKPLTDKARKDWSVQTFYYNGRYQKFEELEVFVILPDGSRRKVEEARIQDGTVPEMQQMNVYEDSFRQKTVSVGELPFGAMVECRKTVSTNQMIRNHYSEVYYLQDTSPVLHCRVSVTGPDSRPLRYAVINGGVPVKKTSENGKTTYVWESFNVPQIIAEPLGSPPDVARKLALSTFGSWKEVSAYNYRINRDSYDMNDDIRAKVRELTEGKETEEEKIAAIHHYVSRRIRYMGSAMDTNSFIESHKATYTFEKGYGVCRDKALLMKMMLQEAGIRCSEVLINPSSDTVVEVPNLNFAHVICSAETGAGKVYYMDPTAELGASISSSYAGERYVLPVSEKGEDILLIPRVPASVSRQAVVSETEVDAGGALRSRISLRGTGDTDMALRYVGRYYAEPEMSRLLFSRLFSLAAPGGEVQRVEMGRPEDLDGAFGISLEVFSDRYATMAGDYMLIPLLHRRMPFDLFVSTPLTGAMSSLRERRYPIFLDYPVSVVTEDRMTVPAGYRVLSLPPSFSFSEGPVGIEISVKQQGDEIIFSSLCSLERRKIEPQQYGAVKKASQELKRFSKYMVILEKI